MAPALSTLALLLAMALVTAAAVMDALPATLPAVAALRAAVARGRTPPTEVVQRPGVPLAGRRDVELDGVTGKEEEEACVDQAGQDYFSAVLTQTLLTPLSATDLDLLVDTDAWLPLTVFTPPVNTSTASSSPRPVLLLLHATGGDRGSMRARAVAAAQRGYAVLTLDARFHGGWLKEERAGGLTGDGGEGTPLPSARTQYTDSLIAAYRANGTTHPFLLDNVWDLQRVLDWVESKPALPNDVTMDAARVGVTGVSLGGMHAWLLAAADPRIALAAPLIGVQSFAYAADHDAWQARAASLAPLFEKAAAPHSPTAKTFRQVLNVITPGLLTAYDAPQSILTIAPRPFLAVDGELDPRCPLAGVRGAMDAAATAYKTAGHPDAVKLYVAPGVEHDVTPDMWREVDGWLDRWLMGREGGTAAG